MRQILNLLVALGGVVAATALSSPAGATPAGTFHLRTAWKLDGEIASLDATHNMFASSGYGLSFADNHSGPFDGASWYCVSGFDVLAGKGRQSGFCTITTSGGAQIYASVSSRGPVGAVDIQATYTIEDGTNEYKGVTGEITSDCSILQQFHQLACIDTVITK